MGGYSRAFRKHIAEENFDDEIGEEAKLFMKALKLAPDYKGEVYRGLKADSNQANTILKAIKSKAEYWQEKAPMSCSLDPEIAIKFAGARKDKPSEYEVLLKIKTKSGKYLGSLNEGGEEEIIAMPKKYKIKSALRQQEANIHVRSVYGDEEGIEKPILKTKVTFDYIIELEEV